MPAIKPVSYRVLARVFEAEGFQCVRIEGDHLVFTRPDVLRPIVIPRYAAIPIFIIRNNLRTAGDLTRALLRTAGCVSPVS